MSMIFLLSPAKRLDCSGWVVDSRCTKPEFIAEAERLMAVLRKKTVAGLCSLMHVSQAIGALNHDRFQRWNAAHDGDEACPAASMFRGDVYTGLQFRSLTAAQTDYVQRRARILSGLYGLLRPLDCILPYRLEMGTQLRVAGHRNLYQFWGSKISFSINQSESEYVVNLASNEYSKAVERKVLSGKVVDIKFRDWKNGQYKSIMLFSKRARGMMVSWAARNGIQTVQDLKYFDASGYAFCADDSSADCWVFNRS